MSARNVLSATASAGSGTALPARARLEAYEVEVLVAQGNFGFVYRACHHATGQVVAIKEYFPEALATRHPARGVAPRSPNGRERFELGRRAFLDEARSLARFDHPSLVRVLGVFEANGTAYRVMRFSPGPTLLAHRRALGRMPAVDDLRLWVEGLIDVLATLHAAGCAHGAVSPAHTLLRPGERPLLLGFDAVRNALAQDVGQGGAAHLQGTSSAAAEEAAPSASVAVAAEADVHALAATLKYCIDGGAPAASSLAEAWRREGGKLPIPPDFARLLGAIDPALATEASERPRSVADLRRLFHGPEAVDPVQVLASAHRRDSDRRHDARDSTVGATIQDRPQQRTAAEAAAHEGAADETGAATAATPLPRDEPTAVRESEADVADGRVPAADGAPPMPPAAGHLRAAAPYAKATDGTGTLSMSEAREPNAPPAAAPTGDEDVASRRPWPRRWAVSVAAAVSLASAVAAVFWAFGRVESSPPPPPPPAAAAALAAPTVAAPAPVPAKAAASASPKPVVAPPPASEAGAAVPAAAVPKAASAPTLVAPARKATSPPVAKKPNPAAKTAAPAAKVQSPRQVCRSLNGFALYQCMQLQCAKPANAKHADCARLR